MQRLRPRVPRSDPHHPAAALQQPYQKWQTFLVEIVYQDSPLELDDHVLTMFAHGLNPAAAAQQCRYLWAIYSKELLMKPGEQYPEYPKLNERSDVTVIDFKIFISEWKMAQRHMGFCMYKEGHQHNPLVFVCYDM